MNNPLVSIVIVNWNGKKLLKACLNSLSCISYKNTEILLVDNASKDDSVVFVKNNYPKIIIIENKLNLGFAEGNNVGLQKSKGDAILLLNPDTLVEENFLDELVKTLYEDKNIGAVQPKIIIYPNKNQIDSIGSFFLMNGNLYHYGREKNPGLPMYNKSMEIFSAKGACMLIKKDVLKKTGLFDKEYFAYFEDTDLSMRILLAGYKVLYEPNATIYHIGGATKKKTASYYIEFHSYKNGIYTYLKNLSVGYLIRVVPLMLLLYELASLIYFLKGNFELAWALQRAMGWNLLHIREILSKRRVVQKKIRVIPDDSFLPKLIKKVNPSYYYHQFFGGMGKYKD